MMDMAVNIIGIGVSRHLRPFPSPPGHLRPSLGLAKYPAGHAHHLPLIVIGHGRAGSGR